jgi:DTW domain-containing protein YfiP
MRREACVCGQAPRLQLSTRLIVVIHSKEWRRSTNTGHLARLAVKGGEVRLHGLPHQAVSSAGIDAVSASTLVLFPGRGARPLTPKLVASLPRPLTLLVPDGNWNQAKKMMNRVPMLMQARAVRLEGSNLDASCLRINVRTGHMSTFEAIAQALGILEGEETEGRLLAFFQKILDGMVHSTRRGRPGRDLMGL